MFSITEEGSSVSLKYVNRYEAYNPSLSQLHDIRHFIANRTGIEFTVVATPWGYDSRPYLNVYVFANKSNYNFGWNVADAVERSKLVSALKILKSKLEEIGYISKDEINTGQLLQSIIENRIQNPLVSIGDRTYKITLEDSQEPFALDDSVRASVEATFREKEDEMQSTIATMKAQFDADLAAANDTNRRPYPLTARDFFDGWRTWIRDGAPTLGKQFTFAPKYITDGRNTYKIKPEVAKKWVRKGIAAYVNNGYTYVYDQSGNILKTHHTRDAGHLCTGTLNIPTKLEYAEAKSLVLQLIEMLNVIYIHSMTHSTILDIDNDVILHSETFRKYCEPIAMEIRDNPNRRSRDDPVTITTVTDIISVITDGEML